MADVVIDGDVISGNVIQTIDIDPLLGNITIEPKSTHNINVTVTPVGSNVTVDLTLTPSTAVINSTIAASWLVANATTCTASNGLSPWGGSVDPVSGSVPNIDVGNTPGPVTFTLICDDGVNPPVPANAILTVTAAPVVVINSFTVSPAAIETGNPVTASWNVSNATSCTASSTPATTWSGGVSASTGNQTQPGITLGTEGNYTFTLSCTDGSTSDLENRQVSVTDPVGNCSAPTIGGQLSTWQGVFGFAWPAPFFAQNVVGVQKAQYLAMEFSTGGQSARGSIGSIPVASTSGVRTMSIAPCEGQFTELPSACTHVWGLGGQLNWSSQNNPASNECPLAPNSTYFLNYTFTDGISASADTCQINGFGFICFTEITVLQR